MPFSIYKNFKDCVSKNKDKENPEAYCATIMRKVEDVKNEKLSEFKHGDDPDSNFDPEQLARGAEVEKEHTDNEELAKEIAKAHLDEFPDYYTELDKMEAKLKKNKTTQYGSCFDYNGDVKVDTIEH